MRTSYALSPAVVDSTLSMGDLMPTVRPGPTARPVDLVHLTRQTFGDKRLETELLRLFARQAEQIGLVLSGDPAAPAERQTACDLLHMLVGSARAVGAVHVSALAERLELARRNGTRPDELAEEERRPLIEAIAAANAYIAELIETA